MAIRFQCAACSQPIEVDDEWAMRLVACPYCRRTVTAPRESFLPEVSEIPTAKPSGSPAWAGQETVASEPPMYAHRGPSMALRRNHIGTAAAVLAGLAIAFVVAFLLVTRPHQSELLELSRTMQTGGFGQMMKAQQEMIDKNGGRLPSWMTMMILCELAGGMVWFAALICGLIGLRGVYDRRDKAIIALVICGILPIVACCGGGAFF